MEESIRRKNRQRKDQMMKLEELLLKENSDIEKSMQSIIEESTSNLVSMIRIGKLSAVEVLKAFQFKALQVTNKINCITEFIPEAQKWAEERDRIPIEDRKPLHGIPMSIKESFDVQGMDSTIGLAKYLYNPAAKNAILVQILLDNGAVPFCKTNVPQTLLSGCCSNPIFGKTHNPHDMTRTPGGSSGGEAALISSGGSLVGIGSDLAGSCRTPANCSGCCGFKFTSTRVSTIGLREVHKGIVGVASCTGILGRDPYIVALVAQAVIEAQHANLKDISIVPAPWNESLFSSDNRLTIGYFDDTEFFPCTPGVKRAVQEAKKALESLGHRVVPFAMIDPAMLTEEALKLVNADNGRTITEILEGELQEESKAPLAAPSSKRREILTSPIMSVRARANCHSVFELWETLIKRKENVQDLSDRMNSEQIDIILSPVHVMPAGQHFIPNKISPTVFYTVFANYCDFASGTVPVTKQSEEDQILLKDYPESDFATKVVKKATHGAVGMPIGVLISGRSFQEELVLRVMQELVTAI